MSMDLNQFLRGFFGFPGHGNHGFGSNFPNDFGREPDENADRFDDPFSTSPFQFFDEMEKMFNQHFVTLHPFEIPDLQEFASDRNDPRSLMLKEPDCECKQDQDCEKPNMTKADDTDMQRRVDWRLKVLPDMDIPYLRRGGAGEDVKSPDVSSPQVHWRNFSKSFSSRMIRRPDGSTEEHRTSVDDAGNRVTTVRRSIGDQSCEVTTHFNKDGLQEEKKNFINMDEGDLSEFEKRWNGRTTLVEPSTIVIPSKPRVCEPSGDPTYLKLFKKFFG